MKLINILTLTMLAICMLAGCGKKPEETTAEDPSKPTAKPPKTDTSTTKTMKKADADTERIDQQNVPDAQDAKGNATKTASSETDTERPSTQNLSTTIPLVDFAVTKTGTGLKVGLEKSQTVSYHDAAEKPGSVKELVMVTDNNSPQVFYGGPVLAPTEDYMLYRVLKNDGKRPGVQLLKQTVGSKSTTVAIDESRSVALFPTITADGTGFVYCSNRITGLYALWLRKFKGTARRKLTNSVVQAFSTSVSPDGATVAFTGLLAKSNDLQIWTVNTNTGLSTQLCVGADPQVSPDGKRIMFLRKATETENTQIWLSDLQGGELTQVTDNTEYSVKDARWSPDGSMIVCSANQGEDDKGRLNYDIWVMKADGSDPQRLTTNGSHDDKPCFDRHGKQIFFRSNRGTQWNLWSFKLGR